MKQYHPTIGLEVHAELSTQSKMFCGCKNQPHASAVNTHVCPVCLAHPGTLPVPNKQAIGMVLQFGAAVQATQAVYSEFDRKNYFYPDIPKAYQISQYQFPFLTGGSLHTIELTRVHLEEDTARSSHELVGGSLVDFNRAGVPLMELVTEPVIHDAKTAGDFARELQLLLQTLGISHANMERGEMRIEANISVSDTAQLGTKVEVKNINSFKAVEAAIAYEIARQVEVIESGGVISSETRGWDENKNCTFSQRSKETAQDYRYFPDPDIPKLDVSQVADFSLKDLQESLPLLPAEKRLQYKESGIAEAITESIIADAGLDLLLQQVFVQTQEMAVRQLASNYLSVDIARLRADGGLDIQTFPTAVFVELLQLAVIGDVGSRAVKDLLGDLGNIPVGTSVRAYAEEKGLLQVSDESAVLPIVHQIIAGNPGQVQAYQTGKEALLKYLVGQGMKLSKGAANPEVLESLLQREIHKDS